MIRICYIYISYIYTYIFIYIVTYLRKQVRNQSAGPHGLAIWHMYIYVDIHIYYVYIYVCVSRYVFMCVCVCVCVCIYQKNLSDANAESASRFHCLHIVPGTDMLSSVYGASVQNCCEDLQTKFVGCEEIALDSKFQADQQSCWGLQEHDDKRHPKIAKQTAMAYNFEKCLSKREAIAKTRRGRRSWN